MKLTFVIIAERDAEFFSGVAKHLEKLGHKADFLTFFAPCVQYLRNLGFTVRDLQETITSGNFGVGQNVDYELDRLGLHFGIRDFERLMLHEVQTFRIKDEQKIKRKTYIYLRALDKIVREADPQRIIVQELGGFVAPLSLYYVARKNRRKHIFIEPTFFSGTVGFLENSLAYHIKLGKIGEETNTSSLDEVRGYINSSLKSQQVIVPRKDRHHFKDPINPLAILNFKNLGKIVRKIKYKAQGKNQEYDAISVHVLRHISRILNRRASARYYSEVSALPKNKNLLYFPLHVPLDFSLTVRSPEYLDQLSLLKNVAEILPKSFVLVTKEHPACIGWYEATELKKLLARSNIVLMHPEINSHELIAMSDAVLTINSKAGAEALLLGKNVFLLGQAFYAHFPGVTRVQDIKELKTLLLENIVQCVGTPKKDLQLMFAELKKYCHDGELYLNTSNNFESFARSLDVAIKENKVFRTEIDLGIG